MLVRSVRFCRLECPLLQKASMFLGEQGLVDMMALLAREDRIF